MEEPDHAVRPSSDVDMIKEEDTNEKDVKEEQ